MLGAFYGSECRGIAVPVYVIDHWVFFLTQYSNVLNQPLSYKVYLADTGEICNTDEILPFVNNQMLGDPLNPYLFHIAPSALETPQNLALIIEGNRLSLTFASADERRSLFLA